MVNKSKTCVESVFVMTTKDTKGTKQQVRLFHCPTFVSFVTFVVLPRKFEQEAAEEAEQHGDTLSCFLRSLRCLLFKWTSIIPFADLYAMNVQNLRFSRIFANTKPSNSEPRMHANEHEFSTSCLFALIRAHSWLKTCLRKRFVCFRAVRGGKNVWP